MSRKGYSPKHEPSPREGRKARSRLRRPLVGGALAAILIAGSGVVVSAGSPSAALQVASDHIVGTGDVVEPISPAEQRREAALSRSLARQDRSSDEAKQKAVEERVRKAHEREKEREAEGGTESDAEPEAEESPEESEESSAEGEEELPIAEQEYSEAEQKIIRKDPKPWGRQLAFDAGYSEEEWMCLHDLWVGESNWEWDATNSTSGAYGIAQALPASKMAATDSDWRTNPVTQMKWGIDYIEKSYGNPCNALQFWYTQDPHWY